MLKFLLPVLLTCALSASLNATSIPATCNNEVGLWFNGTTLAIFSASNLCACCTACQKDPACFSYSYNAFNGRCYKVGPSTQRVYDYRWQSGLVKAITATTTVAPTTTVTVAPTVTATLVTATTTALTGCFISNDIFYNNTGNFNLFITNSTQDCCNLCGAASGCLSWTWSSITRVCLLKSTLPTASEQQPLAFSYSGNPRQICIL